MRNTRFLLAVPCFLLFGLTVCVSQADGAEDGSRPATPGGIYDKPYLRQSAGAAVGGYMDHELLWKKSEKKKKPKELLKRN